MNIGNLVGESKNKDTIVKSFLWNTIVWVFENEKGIDISTSLVSLRFSGRTVFIKTNNPLINSELLLLEWEIKKLFLEKLKKVWIEFWEVIFRYK